MTPKSAKLILRACAFLMLLAAVAAHSQDHSQDKDADTGAAAAGAKGERPLAIVVTGGEEKKPVDSASVYIRFVEGRKLGKDKKVEMNLKTNQAGICHIPVVPPGKFLIQVIAEGWKTYGEYYEPGDTNQAINITLVRPPKWY
jgi:hypothetical protein